MTPKLTEEQRRAVQQSSEEPVCLEDDQTHVHYVLLRLDLYEQLQKLADADNAALPSTDQPSEERRSDEAALPPWCHVYEGLTDPEIAELEAVVLSRCNLTRPS
jgi:hypothetical protein